MVRFKVRPKRDTAPPACLPALTALLACFASHPTDLRATGECATKAQALHLCMKGNTAGGSKGRSSINHLLSQVGKK